MRASFGERTRAVRRSIAASLQRRAALSPGNYPGVSELLAGDRSVPGRSPSAARGLGGCVDPLPAGAASYPANITPHDSALGGPDHGDYIPVISVLSSAGATPRHFERG